MRKQYLILIALAVIIVLVLLLNSKLVKQSGEKKVSDIKLNPDTLYLSSPVTSMDGKLTLIQGNTIAVTHHYVLSDAIGNKDVTVRFTVTPQTKIFRPPTYVPFLFKSQPANNNEVLKQSDLKPGMFVAVTTNGDLRVAQSAPYEATSIQITRIANNITGTISSVSGNTLTITAPQPPYPASFPPQSPLPAQTYTVSVTPDTEISQKEFNEGAPHQLDASSLVKGAVVAVYSAQDVGVERSLTALLITVFDHRPVPSPSAIPKTKP